ncbi:MAG: hypothetical protein IIB58_07500 [Planctomycetes bacterium]|nr:hypothetical protein [Planctomycetota bacterium]
MLRRTSPVETYKYVDGVVEKFNAYVEQDILPKLCSRTLAFPQITTGLRYITTRELPEHESDVLELLTMHFTGKEVLPVYEDALRTADWYDLGPARLTRTLASAIISKPHEQRDQLYERRITGLGRPAGLTMLGMIKPYQNPASKRRLINLIRKTTRVKRPEPIKTWTDATEAELSILKTEWASLIDPGGDVRKALEQAAKSPPTEPVSAPDEASPEAPEEH